MSRRQFRRRAARLRGELRARIAREREETRLLILEDRRETEERIDFLRSQIQRPPLRGITKRGIDMIQFFEGTVLRPYEDVAGHCTVGTGHLIHHGNCTSADDRLYRDFSEADAEKLLKKDLEVFSKAVDEAVKVPLEPHQRDVLISFTFNNGIHAFQTSTLLRLLNKRRYKAVPAQLMRWVYAGGVVVEGLENRREAEAKTWRTGKYPPF